MWSKAFWIATLERTIFTAAETLLALLTADGFGIINLGAGDTWSVVGLAAIAAVLKSIVSASRDGNPSAINAERLSVPDGDGAHRA